MLRYRHFFNSFNLSCLILLLLYYLFLSPWKSRTQRFNSLDYCLTKKTNHNDHSFHSNILYIAKLNILYCEIPKAASTNIRRVIYGYLNGISALENLDRKSIWIDNKSFFKQFYLTHSYNDLLKDENVFKFLIVRHPFRRIYSVYYDKFVNNHFDDTLSGWKQLEEDILLQINANLTVLTIRRNDIKLDFRTFLLYIIECIRNKKTINSHWELIVQRCGLCYMTYDWIGKTENFIIDGNFLINKLNENSNQSLLQFPSKHIDKKNENRPANEVFLNDVELNEFFRNTIKNTEDFRVLIEYYRPDFQMFNYAMPHL